MKVTRWIGSAPLRVLTLLALFGVSELASATCAWAQDEEPSSALVEQGVDAFKDERYDQALSLFLEAKIVLDDPNLDWNIARAFEERGDCPNARVWFERVRAREAGPDDDAKNIKKISRKAKKKLDALESECPDFGFVEVRCADPLVRVATPQGYDLACPASVAVAVGEATFTATLPGERSETRTVTVESAQTVLIDVPTLVIPREVPPPVAPPPPAPPPSWLEQRTALFWTGVGSGALGAVGLGMSVYYQGVTDDTQQEYDTLIAQPSLTDDDRARADELQREGNQNADIANALRFGGIGLLALGAGLVVADIVLADGDGGEPSAVEAALLPMPGGATLRLGVSF